MAWTYATPTFMTGYQTPAGRRFTYNMGSFERASAKYGGHQIKAALQREVRDRGATLSNNLRSVYLKHYKGIGQQHDRGFMDIMGPGGQIGLRSYNLAKERGFKPEEIKTLASKYGMYLPSGAEAAYQSDIAAEKETQQQFDSEGLAMWQKDVADLMKSFTKDPIKPPEATVLRGQAGRVQAKKGRLAGTGTDFFKRGYKPVAAMQNLGNTATQSSTGPLNIA